MRTADEAVAALHRAFLATPYRPTSLSTAARTVVRLVDELSWLNAIVVESAEPAERTPANHAACAVKVAAAAVLEQGAELLEVTGGDCQELHAAMARAERRGAQAGAERDRLPAGRARRTVSTRPTAVEDAHQRVHHLARPELPRPGAGLRGLDDRPQHRSDGGGRAAQLAASGCSAASPRGWRGRCPRSSSAPARTSTATRCGCTTACAAPSGSGSPCSSPTRPACSTPSGSCSARSRCCARTRSTPDRRRCAGWPARSSGSSSARRCSTVIGTNTTLLWFLLPLAILFAGVAPAAISFAAGQAAFTLTLVILFNIIQPAGWRVGLLRVEDIALGCAVSLAVGLLFWPRGAGAALRRALADAYVDSARYLASAVEFGTLRCDARADSLGRADRGRQSRGGGGAAPRRHLSQLSGRARRQAAAARRDHQPRHRRRRPAPRRRRGPRPVAARGRLGSGRPRRARGRSCCMRARP